MSQVTDKALLVDCVCGIRVASTNHCLDTILGDLSQWYLGYRTLNKKFWAKKAGRIIVRLACGSAT
jgi:hypothetical protein